jgi:hypothetical protein
MFTCVITLNASALFAYLLSSIGNICGELFKQSSKFKDDMYELKKYLSQKNLNKEL